VTRGLKTTWLERCSYESCCPVDPKREVLKEHEERKRAFVRVDASRTLVEDVPPPCERDSCRGRSKAEVGPREKEIKKL